jgi:hypothetical protein
VVSVGGARRVVGHVEAAAETSERGRRATSVTGALIARQGNLREVLYRNEEGRRAAAGLSPGGAT